jgi:hypothetical protein
VCLTDRLANGVPAFERAERNRLKTNGSQKVIGIKDGNYPIILRGKDECGNMGDPN